MKEIAPSEETTEVKQKLNKTQKKARNRQLRIDRKKAVAKDKRKEKKSRLMEKNVEKLKEMGIEEDKEKRDEFFKQIKEEKENGRQRLFDALNDEKNPKFIIDCDFE